MTGICETWWISVLYVVALLVYAADQVLKWMVRTHLVQNQMVGTWVPGFYLDYIRNAGGAFSILEGQHWLLAFIAAAVIVGVIYVDRRYRPTLWNRVAMALVVGGALGNLTDRVLSGTVVDYVYFRPINWPVFNLADMAIDAGVIMLVLWNLRSDKSHRPRSLDEDVKE